MSPRILSRDVNGTDYSCRVALDQEIPHAVADTGGEGVAAGSRVFAEMQATSAESMSVLRSCDKQSARVDRDFSKLCV